MATTVNKQRLLGQVLARAPKSAPTVDDSGDGSGRGVLEQFIFGLCREGATTPQAEVAYANLKKKFYDWNEIRVSSYREIEETLDPLPGAESKAHRIIAFLQEVFEIHFSFDLDKFQKEGMKQAIKKLARFKSANDFICAWVTQRSLGGHAIPVDEPTMRCVVRLGLIDDETADLDTIRGSLEHQVAKVKGVSFTEAISEVACASCTENPRCNTCPFSDDCPSARVSEPEPPAPTTTPRRKPK